MYLVTTNILPLATVASSNVRTKLLIRSTAPHLRPRPRLAAHTSLGTEGTRWTPALHTHTLILGALCGGAGFTFHRLVGATNGGRSGSLPPSHHTYVGGKVGVLGPFQYPQ